MYKLKMFFDPDGDYAWDFVPNGMENDAYNISYQIKKDFLTYDTLLEWTDKNIPFLIEYIHGKETSVKDIIQLLKDLHIAVKENNFPYEKGLKDWTETFVEVKEVLPEIKLGIPVSNDFYERFYNSNLGITYGDIKSAIEKLVEQKENEKKDSFVF